jgi:hypothetical protein
MEHKKRKTQKSLQTHQQRANNTKLYRKLTKLHIQKNNFNQEPTVEPPKHSALNHDNEKAGLPKKLI